MNQPTLVAVTTQTLSILELSVLIREWAHARKLITGSTPQAQYCKLAEEFLMEAHAPDLNREMMKDAIGDSYVVCTILAGMEGIDIEALLPAGTPPPEAFNPYYILGQLAAAVARKKPMAEHLTNFVTSLILTASVNQLDFTACVNEAYDEIKHRTGEMRNGVFVKQEDLDKEVASV